MALLNNRIVIPNRVYEIHDDGVVDAQSTNEHCYIGVIQMGKKRTKLDKMQDEKFNQQAMKVMGKKVKNRFRPMVDNTFDSWMKDDRIVLKQVKR